MGICLGAGYKFAFIEGNPIHIDFRYFQSLSTLHDASDAIDIKNTSILFNIGIDL